MRTFKLAAVAALMASAAACDKAPVSPSTDSPSAVGVKFGTSSTVSASYSTDGTTGLLVEGTNGALNITNVSFIVAELELEKVGVECDTAVNEDACESFEAAPSFVQLPLPTGAVEVTRQSIPAAEYGSLEFEVENLSPDEDDSLEKQQQITDLLNSIKTTHGFGDWPEKASMVVEGTFTAAGSTNAVPFRVYFDAEIEVEMLLNPTLLVDGSGVSRSLAVDVQPGIWFNKADGTVWDLSQHNYNVDLGNVVEFELEMENGFQSLEIETD